MLALLLQAFQNARYGDRHCAVGILERLLVCSYL